MLFSWEHQKYQNIHPGAHFGTSLGGSWGGRRVPPGSCSTIIVVIYKVEINKVSFLTIFVIISFCLKAFVSRRSTISYFIGDFYALNFLTALKIAEKNGQHEMANFIQGRQHMMKVEVSVKKTHTKTYTQTV